MRIAILTSVCCAEFGVARVISSQLPFLVDAGFEIDLYACELDRALLCSGVQAVRVPTHLKGLRKSLIAGRYDVIIAHTDPFYQFLTEDDCGAFTIGYEHGFPPVELCLPEEREARLKEIGNRQGLIYPTLNQIVTISRYGAEYLNWPKASVIYNGADHYERLYKKRCPDVQGPIKILTVTRYRKGEWKDKGLDHIIRLKKELGKICQITVIGRGDEDSARKLNISGINTPGVVTDQELASYYSECDALVSFSQWELFNLPLAEAGFAHKPALVLNLCAHPEVTPFVFDSYETLRDYLKNSTRDSLKADGEKMFAYVHTRFRWKQNGEKLVRLIRSSCSNPRFNRPMFSKKVLWAFWNFREFLRQKIYKKWKKRS
jgi:glycosyltransferase involved in cell wall biosynthesis